MADSKKSAVPTHDHDRIVAPSVKADGTFDQTDPEFIGGEKSVEAAGEQAAVQAASVVDQAVRTNPDESPEFESVDKLRDQQESAAESAREAAESAVKSAQG